MDHNSSQPELYAVLGVAWCATSAEIRAAYLRLSLEYHPDRKNVSPAASHEKFVKLQEAYETLGDPGRRREYDSKFPLIFLARIEELEKLDYLEDLLDNLDRVFDEFRGLAWDIDDRFSLPSFCPFSIAKSVLDRKRGELIAWRFLAGMAAQDPSSSVDKSAGIRRALVKFEKWMFKLDLIICHILMSYFEVKSLRCPASARARQKGYSEAEKLRSLVNVYRNWYTRYCSD
ncbi:hypothetical protein GGR52DRAFT_155738 [Hypoxylon sp. FL1284]|nr:hypothetical protein GGR52DRAFT_155738 [Hypoxylon sp. FL1284]